MKPNPKLNILHRALRDPVISSRESSLEDALREGHCVSEWVSDGGPVIKATYRVHPLKFGRKLKKLYDSGFVGGRPRLSDVYLPEESRNYIPLAVPE